MRLELPRSFMLNKNKNKLTMEFVIQTKAEIINSYHTTK